MIFALLLMLTARYKMSDVSFSYYQIIIVIFFLAFLILAHFYIRKNKGFFSNKLGTPRYIQILEDLSISPSEKIRLIKAGNQILFLASTKGASPTVQVLDAFSNRKTKSESVKQVKHLENKRSTNVTSVNSNLASSKQGYGNALKTAIQQARKMNPHVSF